MNGAEAHTVLFIGGSGRSGSTLLERILAEPDDAIGVGELRVIFDADFSIDEPCGCGLSMRDCEFWSPVLEEFCGGFGSPHFADLQRLTRKYNRNRSIPFLRTPGWNDRLAWYQAELARLYSIIARRSSSRLIVDATKTPAHGYMLRGALGDRLRVLHLVRDPRAVAYSWTRVRARTQDGDDLMPRYGAARTAFRWPAVNLLVQTLGRSTHYHRLRYEDFTRAPERHLDALLELVDGEPRAAELISDGRVRLSSGHAVRGNPMRSDLGWTPIVTDTEWVERFTGMARHVVTGLTSPLLLAYGYGLRGG